VLRSKEPYTGIWEASNRRRKPAVEWQLTYLWPGIMDKQLLAELLVIAPVFGAIRRYNYMDASESWLRVYFAQWVRVGI